jgi:hypothetical protein
VKAEATAETALTRGAPGRGRKRKVENDDEDLGGSPKRTRKALLPQSRRNNSRGAPAPLKLEEGAVSWASDDDETFSQKELATNGAVH